MSRGPARAGAVALAAATLLGAAGCGVKALPRPPIANPAALREPQPEQAGPAAPSPGAQPEERPACETCAAPEGAPPPPLPEE